MEALVFGFLVKLIMVPVTRIHQFLSGCTKHKTCVIYSEFIYTANCGKHSSCRSKSSSNITCQKQSLSLKPITHSLYYCIVVLLR